MYIYICIYKYEYILTLLLYVIYIDDLLEELNDIIEISITKAVADDIVTIKIGRETLLKTIQII